MPRTKKEEEEKLDLEQKDWVVEAMQKELAEILDDSGKPLPHQERHVLRAICQMAAFSMAPQKMANNIGLPTHRIKNILKSVSVQREISRLQTELYERDAVKMFKRMLPHAANTIYGLIDNADKDSTRVEAAKVILDRALGKPTQTIEQTTTLIKDVLTRLNNTASTTIEDAQIVPDAAPDKEQKPMPASEHSDPLEEILGMEQTKSGS